MDLDNLEEIKALDKSNVLGSVQELSKQCEHAYDDASKIEVSDSYKNVKTVVMCGMGGSGLGARVIESLYQKELKIPFYRVNDYNLPGWVNSESLVICSSYSGNTEETIENAHQAISRNAKWMAIGAGGKLLDIAELSSAPYYKIVPTYNPSNQPRMAIGYSVVGQLVLCQKAGIINIQNLSTQLLVNSMVSVDVKKTMELAQALYGKVIMIIAAEHLVGAAHVFNNQLNENAKVLTADYPIPELNHHLMEGLTHPLSNKDNIIALFVNSTIYNDKIKKRFEITREIVGKNNIATLDIDTFSEAPISQAFELIQFGAYTGFYLSMLYGTDPAPIPWVDYFKNRLA